MCACACFSADLFLHSFHLVREHCSTVLINFMLHYPLTAQRLQQHLNFLLVNLSSYPELSGRLALLDCLNHIITKVCISFRDLCVCVCVCVCARAQQH